jgi:hypothetical protein
VKDYLSVEDLDPDGFVAVLDLADELRRERHDGGPARHDLDGATVAMVFEKPSTRTRVSFQVAVAELGGHPLPLSAAELQLGRGETVADTGAVLDGVVHSGDLVHKFECGDGNRRGIHEGAVSKGGFRKRPSRPSRARRPPRGRRAWLLWRAFL